MPLPTPQQIGQFLEQQAKKNKSIFYSDLVAHFSLPPLEGAWLSHPLSEIFEVLDQQDANQNRPFRTSVVITKEGNMPGNGFFEALSRLKNIHATNDSQRMSVFTTEINNAFSHPW